MNIINIDQIKSAYSPTLSTPDKESRYLFTYVLFTDLNVNFMDVLNFAFMKF